MSTFIATIETTRGTITAELFDRDCPDTVETFTRLANAGFYDGAPVAAVAPGLVVEAAATRTADEPTLLAPESVGNRNRPAPGALLLAREGDRADAARLLFVTGAEARPALDGSHTVFGMTDDGVPLLAELRDGDMLRSVRVRS
jgi:peptidyl-prolyl cis-trans isomerase B (cyclophilin B)